MHDRLRAVHALGAKLRQRPVEAHRAARHHVLHQQAAIVEVLKVLVLVAHHRRGQRHKLCVRGRLVRKDQHRRFPVEDRFDQGVQPVRNDQFFH